MPTDPRHGLKGALDTLAATAPAPAAADPAAEAEQPDMFADAPLLGTLRIRDTPGGLARELPKRAGPGRPPGSRNRSTRQMIDLITGRYGHPLLRLAELAATPIDVLAATLNCSMLEAAEFSRKVQNDLAPYVAQKLPQMHQIENVTAGMLLIQIGAGGDQAAGGSAHGLDMRLVENQGVSEGEDEQSDGGSRTQEEKP